MKKYKCDDIVTVSMVRVLCQEYSIDKHIASMKISYNLM